MRPTYIAFLIFYLNLCERFIAAENTLDTGQPYLEWCEGAHERRRVTVSECAGVPFVYPYPKCYCLNGMYVSLQHLALAQFKQTGILTE